MELREVFNRINEIGFSADVQVEVYHTSSNKERRVFFISFESFQKEFEPRVSFDRSSMTLRLSTIAYGSLSGENMAKYVEGISKGAKLVEFINGLASDKEAFKEMLANGKPSDASAPNSFNIYTDED